MDQVKLVVVVSGSNTTIKDVMIDTNQILKQKAFPLFLFILAW